MPPNQAPSFCLGCKDNNRWPGKEVQAHPGAGLRELSVPLLAPSVQGLLWALKTCHDPSPMGFHALNLIPGVKGQKTDHCTQKLWRKPSRDDTSRCVSSGCGHHRPSGLMVAEAWNRCREPEGLLRYVVFGGGSSGCCSGGSSGSRGITWSRPSKESDEQDVQVHTCDPSTQDVGAGQSKKVKVAFSHS